MELEQLLAPDQPFARPRDRGRGIGIVGAGGIVRNAHLPAYRKAGLNVVAIFDVDGERARSVAAEFGIDAVCASADELIARADVEIVDIAVTPEAQQAIAAAAIAAAKHVLCQKPLAETYEQAQRLVELAAGAGVQLAVHQQMRWSPGIRFTRALIERGWYGELTEGTFDVDLLSDWGWMGRRPRVEYLFNSIHYFDAARFLFGEPRSVLASSATYPGQAATAETRSFTILEYSDVLRVVVLSNHNNWSGESRALLRCHGTDGRSEATLGMKDYPERVADTFRCVSRTRAAGNGFEHRFEDRWLPDAFAGPLLDLQCAIEDGRPARTSGEDNLGTLRIIEAAYRSIGEGRRVDVAEIDSAVVGGGA